MHGKPNPTPRLRHRHGITCRESADSYVRWGGSPGNGAFTKRRTDSVMQFYLRLVSHGKTAIYVSRFGMTLLCALEKPIKDGGSPTATECLYPVFLFSFSISHLLIHFCFYLLHWFELTCHVFIPVGKIGLLLSSWKEIWFQLFHFWGL